METIERNGVAKAITRLACIATLAWVAVYLTGCAGMEFGVKGGVYRVDEHQEATRAHRSDTKPLACMLWRDCSKMEAQGS